MLESLVIESQLPADSAFICLHGLGAAPQDVAPIAKLLSPGLPRTRFIFPAAPYRRVTANGGYEMRAWYDILRFEPQRELNHQHIEQISQTVRELIVQQRKQGIEKVVLAGFSQGGAIAYQTALSHPELLAGLVVMSSYVPSELSRFDSSKPLPILIQHGSVDDVVAPALADHAKQHLEALGLQPELELYPISHTIGHQQIKSLERWLQATLSAS
ncbi:alpha/beta hydrolase [Aliagarivorans taiwanensis]|uniref:alpha/beta hydrolase n=1 Tax=Aliagarivorans taiwanensis TaxID=561966 RepID=UPI000422C99B|nr:alpha/beta fold hydrolase [Aliagarivorans taiwanensis]